MRAASSSSTGRVMKYWRMMNVASTLGAPNVLTRMSGQCVSIMPHWLNIWNNGTIVTSAGIRSPISTTRKSTPCPRNRMRANA